MYELQDIEKHLIRKEIIKIEDLVWANKDMFSNASFESGFLGPAIFYCYWWLYTGEKKFLTRAEWFLEKALSLIGQNRFDRLYKTDSVDNHIAQVGRFAAFVKANNMMNLDADAMMASFDPVLFGLMNSKIRAGNFDIQSGALAAGYYFLGRSIHTEQVNEYLSVLIKGLGEKAAIDGSGNYSWSVPALYNRTYLGISHGSALIISFLCNAYERGIETQQCARILEKAASFLLSFKSDFGKGLFPNYVEDEDTGPKQFSLCYGDIGIGYALLRMGTLLQNAHILNLATGILDDCSRRRKEDNLTLDASLTYGAAGVASTFERIHDITGNKKYLHSAKYWYSKIPEYATHCNAFGGYRSRISQENNGIWDLNFGWGITGIGTSLVRYLDPALPSLAPLLLIA